MVHGFWKKDTLPERKIQCATKIFPLIFPMLNKEKEKPSPVLARDEAGLFLKVEGDPGLRGKVRVDFTTPAWRRRLARVRSEPLVRAMGRKSPAAIRLLDSTGGLGRDAFLLAAAGFQVTACERNPILAALVTDGLERARHCAWTREIARRLAFHQIDTRRLLTAQPFDVVYLDPMFSHRNTAARVRKDLQMVRLLVEPDPDMAELFHLARERAGLRVVVKRSRREEWLDDQRPAYSVTARTTRFDIYLAAPRPAATEAPSP